MKPLYFRKFVVSLVTVTMLAGQFFWPGEQVAAATAMLGGTWTAHSGACDANDPNVRSGGHSTCRLARDATGAEIAYPAIRWVEVATLEGASSTGYDLSYLGGNKLVLAGLRSESMLNVTANKAADMINTFPVGVPVVFARYNPGTADLRVDMFKTEKVGTGLKLLNAVFTPHHGGLWAANGSYAPPADRAAGKFGPNPFARFANAGDDAFHNISEDGVNVVVGHAMRTVQAAVGMIAVADYRFHQWKTTKKSLLKKKVTYHIDGYAKSIWKMATPPQFQPRAQAGGAICATGNATANCPDYAVAPAMINIDTWTGGNLDESEDKLYEWQKTYSGFTVLAFVLLVFVMAFAVAAIAIASGFAASSTSVLAAGVESAFAGAGVAAQVSALGVGALSAGAMSAAVYGIVATLQDGSLTDIQQGLGGRVITAGTMAPAATGSVHEAALVDNTNVKMTQVAIDASLVGVQRTSYGDCNAKTSAAGCGGSAKGMLPRSDSYGGHDAETNSWVGHDYVQFYRDNGAPVRF